MSLEEELYNCGKIHDILAEHWNWAYYDTDHSDTSWLLGEYVKRLKDDVNYRVPVILGELKNILDEYEGDTFSILDVGCGVGGFLKEALLLSNQEYPQIKIKASGIDISDEMINYASENLDDFDAELVCDSITNRNLRFLNEPFNLAIMMVTLSFYNDENAIIILNSIHDKLDKSGKLVVMDFAWSYKWSDFALFSKPLQKLTNTFFSHLLGESFHFSNRTEEELTSLLDESNFEVDYSYLSEKTSKMKGMLVIRAGLK